MFEIYIYLHYLMFVVKQMLMIDHSNFEPAVVVTVVIVDVSKQQQDYYAEQSGKL